MEGGCEEESDEALMHVLQTGNRQQKSKAFSTLVHRHSERFYSLAFRITGRQDMAEDTVQTCFVKLWQRPEVFHLDRKVRFTTWFYRIVTNAAIDMQRKQRFVSEDHKAYQIAQHDDDTEAQTIQKQKEEALEEAINILPDKQKLALNLCFYEGVSNKDAADIMNINVKALESLLMRAKTKMKDYIKRKSLYEYYE